MAPTVSVVIPCYNASGFLRETLDSVLAQTEPALEVLVIDDGSRDDSAAVAESYGAPVRVIRQENQGESVARNRGIEEARGEWIAYLDSDDLWEPTKLARQLAAITPETVCIHSNWRTFGAVEDRCDFSQIPPERRYAVEEMLTFNNPFLPSSMLVRRSLPVRFPSWTKDGEDMLYCLDMLQHGRAVLVPEYLCRKRVHGSCQSVSPEIPIRWHRVLERWLLDNRPRLGDAEVERLRGVLRGGLVKIGQEAYWARDRQRVLALRSHLAQYREDAAVAAFLKKPLYPNWLFRLKDAWDALCLRRRA